MAAGDLDDLLRRLDRLDAEREITRTIAQFGHAIDAGREEEWMDCFLPDAVLDVLYGDRPPSRLALGTRHERGVIHEGREQLAAWIAGHTRPPAHRHEHLYVEPRIDVDGDVATSTTCMTRVDVLDGRPEVYAFGRYHDRWQRCPDGRWRLRHRQIEIQGQRDVPSPYPPVPAS